MVVICVDELRKRAEHNEGRLDDLEVIIQLYHHDNVVFSPQDAKAQLFVDIDRENKTAQVINNKMIIIISHLEIVNDVTKEILY